jgi:hypothetical protein
LGYVETKEFQARRDFVTHIQIVNAATGEFLCRELTDVTEWAGLHIFSWHPVTDSDKEKTQ